MVKKSAEVIDVDLGVLPADLDLLTPEVMALFDSSEMLQQFIADEYTGTKEDLVAELLRLTEAANKLLRTH